MRYYVDFDRTAFDTDSFTPWLRERLSGTGIDELPYEAFLKEISIQVTEGKLTFDPGELSQFLYADAAQFLRDKENAVTIITYGNKELQEAKVKSALYGIPRMSVMYTGDVRKGAFLAPHTHLHVDAVLADDSSIELEILEQTCPDLALFEMRRDGKSGDGRWPVIQSLTELS